MIFLGKNSKENPKCKNCKIITFELEKEQNLKKENIDAVYFHRIAQNENVWNNIILRSKDWLENWSNKKIYDGSTIRDILQYNDVSLWWFVYEILWDSKNGIFETFYQFYTITALIEEYTPKKIQIEGNFDFPIYQMIDSLKNTYSFQLENNSEISSILFEKISRNRFNFLIQLLILKIIYKFTLKKNKKIFIFSSKGGKIQTNDKGKRTALDPYFVGLEDFFDKNKERINFIALNNGFSSKNFSEFLSNCKSMLKNEFVPWEINYSVNELKNMLKDSNEIKQLILKIENTDEFKKSFDVDGTNFYQYWRNLLLEKLPNMISFSKLELKATERFFLKNNPEVIFTTNGFSPNGRALCYNASKKGRSVISPQLGIISPEFSINTAFQMFKGMDLRLIPKYLVWGNHFKEIIEKKEYPIELIKQVGFWKTGMDNNTKPKNDYILYIGGANRVKLEYVLSIDEEIFTIKAIHDILPEGMKILVKLHPNFDNIPYEKLLNLKNLVLIKHGELSDINELVSNAKIIVGKASTLIVQAMIMRKPVISINLAGDVDFLGIKEIPFVKSIEELEKKVKQYLKEDSRENYKINSICEPIGEKSISLLQEELMKIK